MFRACFRRNQNIPSNIPKITRGTATPIPAFAPVERPPDGEGEDDDDALAGVVVVDMMTAPVVVAVVEANVVMKLVADAMAGSVAVAVGSTDVETKAVAEDS